MHSLGGLKQKTGRLLCSASDRVPMTGDITTVGACMEVMTIELRVVKEAVRMIFVYLEMYFIVRKP